MHEHTPTSTDVAAPLSTDTAALSVWRDRRLQFDAASPEARLAALKATSTRIRRNVLHTIDAAGLGHVGGDMSVTDILVTLFNGVLRIDPAQPAWPERDRFVLSKGH